jgi:DivIVA domain-containing protein
MQQELSADAVESQSFSTGRRGYEKEEVDAYLRGLAEQIRAYQAASSERLYQNLGDEMGGLLQHARDSADAMLKQAEEDASATRHQAERDAHETKAEAQRQADQINATAEADAAAQIKAADDKVQHLEGVESDARDRLSSLRLEIEALVTHLGTLETAGATDVSPAAEVRLEDEAEDAPIDQPAR